MGKIYQGSDVGMIQYREHRGLRKREANGGTKTDVTQMNPDIKTTTLVHCSAGTDHRTVPQTNL